MSSGSHHKMYHFEVAPPPGIWAKIEAELDEAELYRDYPATLLDLQVTPPAHNWQKILVALDEPSLVNDYAAKLSGIEVEPPATSWNKIKNALDPEPVNRRIPAFLKYAAAAILIGLLAWGGIRLFNGQDSTREPVASNNTISSPEHTTEPANESRTSVNGEIAIADLNAALEEARNDAALEESKKTYAKLEVSSKREKVKNAAEFFFVTDEDYMPTVTTRGLPSMEDEIVPPPPVPDITQRYIVLMTPDGNIIRMSKKLRNLVCCVSGEEVDKDCVDQMKKWREKIASPSATHSPGNFLDLLHMLNTMQDH